jgi:filamentous hemagglutinin family protein
MINKQIRAFVNRLTGRKTGRSEGGETLPARLYRGGDRGGAPLSACLGASVCLSTLVTPASLLALPQDGRVTAGSAAIAYSPSRLDITQTTDKAVIDWRSFNIAADELARFNQPSASSMTLNRVCTGNPSSILGTLTANGRVLLVNPNGVFFGPGSRVDVAGLVATTADITNEDFMAGNLRFAVPSAAPDAAVINEGTITVHEAGLAALVAPVVANTGVIQARLGKVALASGNTFTLDLYGDNLVQFAIDSTVGEDQALGVDSLVSNSGLISADGGTVLLTATAAGRALSKVVNMDGIIEARSVEVGQDGEIILHGGDSGIVSVSGTLDVSGKEAGQQGGSVRVLGDKVGLFDGAVIDASGDAGGGEVLVGGDFQGANPAVKNASATYVDAAATISANGVTAGDGGKVIVWADGATRYDGDISARGGSVSGDGGLVEVSGDSHLDFSGTVDTSAENGTTGTLLLDPTDIVILDGTGDSAADGNDTFAGDPGAIIGSVLAGDASPSSIYESELEGVAATTNIILQATNDITINDLTDDNLDLQTGPINSVSFVADADASGVGAFSMAAGDMINTAGADVTIEGAGLVRVSVSAVGVTLDSSADLGIEKIIASTATISAGGAITDGDHATIAVSGQGVLHASGAITLGDEATDSVHFGSIDATAGAAVAISEDSDLVIDRLTAASASLTSSGNITDSDNAEIVVSGQGVLYASGAITLGDEATDSVHFGSIDATAGTAVEISEDSDLVVDRLSAATISLTSSGSITDSDNAVISVSGQGVLHASGAITLGDEATDSVHFGSIDATAGAAVAISEDSDLVIDRLTAASAALSSSGNITDSATAVIAVTGQGALNAIGSITLGDEATDSVHFGSIDATAGTSVSITEDSDMFVHSLNTVNATMTSTHTLTAEQVSADHITFTADEMHFTGGTGSIVGDEIFLQPVRQGQNIAIAGSTEAGSDSLDLTTGDLAALADGFSMITIGRVDGTGQIYIPNNQFGWRDQVTFNTPDGGILTADVSDVVTEPYAEDPESYNILTSLVSDYEATSFTFMADSPATFWLNGNIKTAGGDIFIDDDITVVLRPGDIDSLNKITDSVIALDTDGGDITFGSMVGHTTYLMLLAGITETVVDGGTINGAVEVYGLRLSGSGGELGVKITSVDNVYSQDKWPAVYTIVTLPAPHYGTFTFNDLPVRGLPIDRDPQNAFLLGQITFFSFTNDLFSIESYALPEGYSDEEDEEDEEDEHEASRTTASEAGFGLTGAKAPDGDSGHAQGMDNNKGHTSPDATSDEVDSGFKEFQAP